MSLRRLGKALIGVRKNRNENSVVKPHYISRRAGKHEKTSKERYIRLPLSLDCHSRGDFLPWLWKDLSTPVTNTYHGRGKLTIPLL